MQRAEETSSSFERCGGRIIGSQKSLIEKLVEDLGGVEWNSLVEFLFSVAIILSIQYSIVI